MTKVRPPCVAGRPGVTPSKPSANTWRRRRNINFDGGSPSRLSVASRRLAQCKIVPPELAMTIQVVRDTSQETKDPVYLRRNAFVVDDIRVTVERDDSEARRGMYRLRALLHMATT
jgi:hypothetical protein